PAPGELGRWLSTHTTRGDRVGLAVSGTWGHGTGHVTGLAIATAGGAACHVDPTRVDPADDSALAGWLADPERPKALHDAKGPTLALAAHGWHVDGLTSDPAIAAYLAQPGQRKLDLADLCRRYLNRELDEDAEQGDQLALDITG